MCEETALMMILLLAATIIILVLIPMLVEWITKASMEEIDRLTQPAKDSWEEEKRQIRESNDK